MPAEQHPAYREELERCSYTLGYVEKTLDLSVSKKDRIDGEVDRIKRHFNSENSQNYIDLLINTTLQDSLALKIRNLVTARSKPYFARVDFREAGKEIERLYIGKMSLMREEDQEIIIVDWRAPVANLYYEERLGKASYACPDGAAEGELSLKRQFSIEGGALREIFDIDITTNDEFLQSYLGANADNRLKEIVSTIQVEQNKIIRADMWTPLIVQGAAGSGKTTIALHRIAYLIYTHEKTFNPENFMIIAPTRFFLSYISEVLPELGVEKVRQSTFEQFAMDLVGKKLKIKDPNDKLARFAAIGKTRDQEAQDSLLMRSSELKSSMVFKEMLDMYVAEVEASFIPREDFTIESRVVMTYEEINNLFINQYKIWPIVKRVDELKKNLTNRLKTQKEMIIAELEAECGRKVAQLKYLMDETDERQSLIRAAFDKRDELIKNTVNLAKKAVSGYIGRISRISPTEHYRDFISDRDFLSKYSVKCPDTELLEFTRSQTEAALKTGFTDLEDLAPLIYLKYSIHGIDEKIPVRHIVIDEAQDFSVFQLYTLKKIVKDSSFTILGDLAQGIHSYKGIQGWSDVSREVFNDRNNLFLTLEQSYRTTVEIMEAANKVIEKLTTGIPKAKPVFRHGEGVRLIKAESGKDIAEKLSAAINGFREHGLKSAAVICKTMEECRKYKNLLSAHIPDIYVLTGKDDAYKGGTAIVPSYLAKGLEFDAVMITDASAEVYRDSELDIKLLYVAMTRALHKLYIYYTGEPSPLLV